MGVKRSNKPWCQPPPAPDQGAPWLVYTDRNDDAKKTQTFCTISANKKSKSKSYMKSIPELHGKSIIASCHGWLVLQDIQCRESFSLWNPVTLQTLHLPPLHDDIPCDSFSCIHTDDDCYSCILTDDANRLNCVLLLFFDGKVFYCRPRRLNNNNSGWSSQTIKLDGGSVSVYRTVTLNGIIYGWASWGLKYILLSMEVATDHDSDTLTLRLSSLRLMPPDLHFPYLYLLVYLVESCGHIYSLFINEEARVSAVEVWELDLKEMIWVEVKSLEGRAFFIGNNNCSTWCWANKNPGSRGGVEGNCVYFVRPDRDVRTLYSYNLQDRCLIDLLPCPNFVTPLDCPIWVMPQHHQSLLVEPEWKQTLDEGVSTLEYKELLQQNETQEFLFSELPLHIIELISKHMHFVDYWNFRESSKIICSAVPRPQCRTENLLPLFMFFEGADGLCKFMDPYRDDSRTINLQLSRDFFTIDFSKDGWLLVRVGLKSLQFLNPFTRVRGEFLPCESMCLFASIGFSTCPTSPDCLVVGIMKASYNGVAFHYLNYGDDTWNHCVHDSIIFSPGTSSPVYHAGAFYFLDKIGYLGVFELIGGQATWLIYGRPHIPDVSIYSCHLVEHDEELLSVFLRDMGKSVKVFRFNRFEKNWVEVKSLGNYSLFLGPSSSFSVKTKLEMSNRIYVSRLREKSIIFYSLETCKYHVFGSEEFLEDLYGTIEPLHCCWV